MKFGIDVRAACSEKRTGKGQWTYGFVRELLQRNIETVLFTDRELPPELANYTSGCEVRIMKHAGMRWHLAVASAVRSDISINAYVSPVSYIVPFLLGKARPVIPIVHDLIAFRGEPHDRKATFIERLTLGRAARSAALLCTVSDATGSDLLLRFPDIPQEKVQPVYADSPLAPLPAKEVQDGIILNIGTLCPRKNQRRLIEAFALLPDELRRKHRLVLIGNRGWHDEEIVKLIGSIAGVEWKGYATDDEYLSYLSQASVFAYPSLYEGFGLPVLDAFRAGVPVVTSDGSSLKEVAADAALVVNPHDVRSLAEGLAAALSDHALRQHLTQKGKERAEQYSWKRTVDLFLSAAKRIDN